MFCLSIVRVYNSHIHLEFRFNNYSSNYRFSYKNVRVVMVATTLAYVYCVHTYSMLYISNHNNICIIFTAEFTENI